MFPWLDSSGNYQTIVSLTSECDAASTRPHLRTQDFSKLPLPHATLSHRWQEREILFKVLCRERINKLVSEPAFAKIRESCHQARCDGLTWIWNSTCCIDKSSSAKLSGAINSMSRWYQNSCVYYISLDDYDAGQESAIQADPHSAIALQNDDPRFTKSKLFTSGWTLQDIIAPRRLIFLTPAGLNLAPRSWSLGVVLHSAQEFSPISWRLTDVVA